MVMQRRLDYGYNAYPVPVVPRASRSARGRGPSRKRQEEKQIHAFEILASVAGKILQETETSPTCGKDKDEGLSLKLDTCELDEKASASIVELQGHRQIEVLNSQDNFSSAFTKNICFAENVTSFGSKSAGGSSGSKVLGDLTHNQKYLDGVVEDVVERKLEAEPSKVKSIKNETCPVSSSSSDFMELEKKLPTHVGSESDIKASSLRDSEALDPFPRRANMNIVSRDDDENISGCSQRCTIEKAYRSPPDIEEKRINESKNWRVSKSLTAGGFSRNDVKPKPVYNCGRPNYARQRPERIVPFKKRKYHHQNPLSSSEGGFDCEGAFSSPDKIVNDEDCAAGERINATGASSVVAGQQAPQESRDCNVKLSIKSFKVPELFIEIPATATIGSLKSTIMEAVTAILGDGLHVGILVQGKKVRDDNKTLIQTGISQDDKLGSLGFMLEPRHGQVSSPLYSKDPPLLSGSSPRTLTRQSASCGSQQAGTSSKSLLTNSSSCTDFDLPSHNTMSGSRALVAVSSISMKALSFHRKSGHPEFVQRRIRRPFSVSEVEALVQAVEKLGTGRWRDVKMRAFDNAKHRTYVDLKDKWKTLVHTARISPQQRRGEPVPQELLDRVLAAHAYWSQQQARHLKSAI